MKHLKELYAQALNDYEEVLKDNERLIKENVILLEQNNRLVYYFVSTLKISKEDLEKIISTELQKGKESGSSK